MSVLLRQVAVFLFGIIAGLAYVVLGGWYVGWNVIHGYGGELVAWSLTQQAGGSLLGHLIYAHDVAVFLVLSIALSVVVARLVRQPLRPVFLVGVLSATTLSAFGLLFPPKMSWMWAVTALITVLPVPVLLWLGKRFDARTHQATGV